MDIAIAAVEIFATVVIFALACYIFWEFW